MKINFKMMLACLCMASSVNGYSQKYFRASANGGISTIQYSADGFSTKLFDPSNLGGGVSAEYINFFNQYVGISAGVGASVYRSKFEINEVLNASLPYNYFEENVEKNFVYNANFKNWEESQMLFTVDIPVGAVGKYSFSDKITAMAGAGVKIQLPVSAKYKLADEGSRTTTGYYDIVGGTLHVLHTQGFYTLDKEDDNWDKVSEGDLNAKTISFAAYLDLGVMHKIGSQNFYYGIYGQYGFTQINSEPENAFLSQYGVAYDSPLNTTAIDKSRLLSFGIKIAYVLPLKSGEEEAEATGEESETEYKSEAESEGDSIHSNIKPELDDHPYTTVQYDSNSLSSGSSDTNVSKDVDSVKEETPKE